MRTILPGNFFAYYGRILRILPYITYIAAYILKLPVGYNPTKYLWIFCKILITIKAEPVRKTNLGGIPL